MPEAAYEIVLNRENQLGEGSYKVVYTIKKKANNKKYAAKIFKMPIEFMVPEDKLR